MKKCCDKKQIQGDISDISILVIIPIHNEINHIRSVIQDTKRAGFDNILVIDDGSSDGGGKIAQLAGAKVVKHCINRGQGAAIQTGLEIASLEQADIVVTIDGDGQFAPDDIMKLIHPVLHEGKDLVIGSRFSKKNKIPAIRKLYNFLASLLTWLLSGTYVRDSQSGFKALGRRALEEISLHTSGYEFCSEMIREAAHAHLAISEVDVRVFYTKESMSKGQSFAVGLKTAAKLLIRSLTKI